MLSTNHNQLDSYNKSTNAGKGTLMSNWHEEEHLREVTGVGRAPQPQHIQKTHAELFYKDPRDVPLFSIVKPSDTTTRIFGKTVPDVPAPASKNVGGTFNAADQIPKVGRKFQLLEQQYLAQIQSELERQESDSFSSTQVRHFGTTTKQEFSAKPVENNTIGRRVMRTQNGSAIEAHKKDVDLLSDMGFYQKPQLSTDAELRQIIPHENYLTAKPITIYSEKLNEGTFYQSKPHPDRPHHKTDGFVKTFHEFSHVKH